MSKKEFRCDSFIYFASRINFNSPCDWHSLAEIYKWRIERNNWAKEEAKKDMRYYSEIKIGETANFGNRKNSLHYKDSISIRRFVKFNGTKEERLFIESYLRSKYAANRNMVHFGNDYFRCYNSKTIKGAENKFFQYVAEAFSLLEQIKGRKYSYESCVR